MSFCGLCAFPKLKVPVITCIYMYLFALRDFLTNINYVKTIFGICNEFLDNIFRNF